MLVLWFGTGILANPSIVTPAVVIAGGGGNGKLNSILLDRKRRRLHAEAKTAKLAQMHQDQLDAIMARYAGDSFLPFPLHDVIAQQQADDDDMIMALLLSS